MAHYQARGARLDFSASDAGGTQGLARVVGLRDGGFSVNWIGADSDRTAFDGDIYSLTYSADLVATTANPVRVVTDTGPSNSYPVNQASTRLAGGGFALFTTDNANYDIGMASANRDVAVRLFDASGASIGQPVYLGTASVLGVTVTTLADGRLAAGWIDTTGGLRAQYLSAQGAPLGQSFSVAKPLSDVAARPDFSSLSNGGWVATYVAQNSAQAHAVFYDAQGNPSSDLVIASNLNNIEGVQGYELADGRVILVWTQQNGSVLEARAQIYSASGAAFGSELTLSVTASSVISVTGLSDGGFAVAFEPRSSGPTEVKVYNSIGQQNGSTLTFNNAIEPSIAALSDGGFVTVWKDGTTGEFHAQAYQAVAAGAMALTGTAGADVLVGQEGNDTLTGLAGSDQLYGSVGNDLLYGGQGDDSIDGGAGNDLLDGGTGVDMMSGGAGNDLYFVDNASDQVVEDANSGTDNVVTSVNFTLGAGVHAEILSTTDHGGTAAINLTGNELANIIIGNAGSNYLDGAAGADKLQGLGGNDFYVVDNASDQVFEDASGGYDNVFASVNYALQAGSYVEVLSTTNHGGTAAINLTGNELANIIIGNAASNVLDGGAGIDKLQGLGGNDFYFVDNASDQVFESAGEGTDNVLASVNYRLQAGVAVEILSSTSHGGTVGINLTGNELANIVIGNAGSNVLDGGAGIDKLQGLGGNDFYVVDNAGDQIFENASQGYDNVLASVNYQLQAGADVEVLSTTSHGGNAGINLTGNALANIVIGNAGANTLDGGGGADKLQGLGGNDTFVLRSTYQRIDIVDFASGQDKINLQGFSGLANGPLASNAFGTGPAATNSSQRILYDGSTGLLAYDADGNGSQGSTVIAQLSLNLALSSNDFVVGG